eukprot:403376079
MESKDNSATVLCSNCKTFFGNHNTNFMCSKCFRESQKQEQQNQSAEKKQFSQPTNLFEMNEPAVSTFQVQPVEMSQSSQQPAFEEVKQIEVPAVAQDAQMADLSQQEPSPQEEVVQVQVNKNLCWNCKRKVGLLGFVCKCDFVFCGKHRYAEEHDCQFDYKQRQQEKLAKENPLVQRGKISKF